MVPSWSSCITTVALTVKSTRTLRPWAEGTNSGFHTTEKSFQPAHLPRAHAHTLFPDPVCLHLVLEELKPQVLHSLKGAHELKGQIWDALHKLKNTWLSVRAASIAIRTGTEVISAK